MFTQSFSNNHLLSLIGGDVLVFLVFSGLGRSFHSMGSALDDVMYTAVPFLLGWVVVSPFTGAYAEEATHPATAFQCAGKTWFFAFPLGLCLRQLIRGSYAIPHWSFMLVAGSFTLLSLGGWRAMFARMRA